MPSLLINYLSNKPIRGHSGGCRKDRCLFPPQVKWRPEHDICPSRIPVFGLFGNTDRRARLTLLRLACVLLIWDNKNAPKEGSRSRRAPVCQWLILDSIRFAAWTHRSGIVRPTLSRFRGQTLIRQPQVGGGVWGFEPVFVDAVLPGPDQHDRQCTCCHVATGQIRGDSTYQGNQSAGLGG